MGAVNPEYAKKFFEDDPRLRERFYVKPEEVRPPPPLSGPNSIAAKIMPPKQVVRNMDRLRHDEFASWNGIAALRNLVADTMPEDQQAVVDAGAATAIIKTMQAWPQHAGIQVSGCGTLVKIAEVDATARRIVLENGGIFELAAAVERLSAPEHADTDGEKYGKDIVHKANFARDCLLKVAGKKTDPRNRKHIEAAIAGGVDPMLFKKLDPQRRDALEQKAHENFLKKKEKREEQEDIEEEKLLALTPWAQTMERDREICVLFPGQGTQKKGMADKLIDSCPEAKALFTKASSILGYDLEDLCRNGPQEKLDQTLYQQPAIFVTALAAMEKAKKEKFETIGRTKMTAGFSLGEYCALVFANAMTFEDGLRLVAARGEAMEAAAKLADTCMASISGVDDTTLAQMIATATEQVDNKGRAYIANYMFPEGRTCSGDKAVLKKLCELVSTLGSGKSAKLINVSGAFHTPYMESAVPKLAEMLEKTDIQQPTIYVLSNVTGEYFMSPDHIRELLKRQIVEPVKWEQQMDEATKLMHQISGYIESGPGKQLKAMMRRINQDAWSKMTVME